MRVSYPLLALALSALLATLPAHAAGPNGRQSTQPLLAELDGQDAETLLFMREEERLARDVYLGMDMEWDLLPFESIAGSEQRHMDAVKTTMDKYGLLDPSDPDVMGVYADAELQQLYDQLMDRGMESYLEALRVGALIEEVDIEDLQVAIEQTDNPDLLTIYGNLLRGSRNHLRTFVGEIERQGDVYSAQYLDQAAVDAIVDSPMERGSNGGAKGRAGKGFGMTE